MGEGLLRIGRVWPWTAAALREPWIGDFLVLRVVGFIEIYGIVKFSSNHVVDLGNLKWEELTRELIRWLWEVS